MYFGNNDMNNELLLSVLQYVFHSDCTLEEMSRLNPSLLQTIIADIAYLSDVPMKVLSGKEFINDNPDTNIIKVLRHVQATFMHHPEDICRSVYIKLNDKLTDIIKKSTIEHDISLAYLLKCIIKEILINGARYTDNTYRYTWKDKLEAFYYICGQLRFIEAATMRSKSCACRSVDLISSLNHARQLTKRMPLMEIIRDSLY